MRIVRNIAFAAAVAAISCGWARAGYVSAAVTASGAGADPFAIVFVELTINNSVTDEWTEVQFTGSNPSVTLTDNTSLSETLSDAGFFISPTMIPLDQLNVTDEPPTGMPGSPFTPLPSLDGVTLCARRQRQHRVIT